MGLGEGVGLGVCVGLGVGVGVNVGVGDGLNVGVGEGVTVGVTVGVSEGTGVSLGAAVTFAWTRFSNWLSVGKGSSSIGMDSLETCVTIWKLYVPTAAHWIVYCTLVVPAPKLEMLTTDDWTPPTWLGNKSNGAVHWG
jgi:hypothetical protein